MKSKVRISLYPFSDCAQDNKMAIFLTKDWFCFSRPTKCHILVENHNFDHNIHFVAISPTSCPWIFTSFHHDSPLATMMSLSFPLCNSFLRECCSKPLLHARYLLFPLTRHHGNTAAVSNHSQNDRSSHHNCSPVIKPRHN